MRIAVCGASGFLGRNLSRFLVSNTHEVVRIGREHFLNMEALKDSLEGVDIVINCCGESFFRKWDILYKNLLYVSRIDATRKLLKAIDKCSEKPHTYIACSSVQIYKDGMIHNDNSVDYGNDYVALLLKEYEAESKKVTNLGLRVIIFRFGYLLGAKSPFLQLLQKIRFFFLQFIIGNGKQLIAWIDIDDAINVINYAMNHKSFSGTYNIASSEVVPMKKFMQLFSKTLKRLSFFKYPQVFLKFFLKEEADNLLKGSFIISKKLQDDGYTAEFCSLKNSLEKFL